MKKLRVLVFLFPLASVLAFGCGWLGSVRATPISFVTDSATPFPGVDDTTGFSSDDSAVDLGRTGLPLLGGSAQVTGYFGQSEANLSHRGTRGLGVMGGFDEQIDSYTVGKPERIEITFQMPVFINSFEVRSLFTDEGDPPTENGEVEFRLEGGLVHTEHVSGQEPFVPGAIGSVTVSYASNPVIADQVIFFVPEGEEYSLMSEFAVAGLDADPLPEAITLIVKHADSLSLTWNPFGNGEYTVQQTDDLVNGNWQDAAGAWPITDTSWVSENISGIRKRFYRVVSQ